MSALPERRGSKASVASDEGAVVRYDPEADVKKMADYFNQKYGSLDKALGIFDPNLEFNIYTFEAALKRWGVRVDDVGELFDHIDIDFSGKVSVQELFNVLELPLQELKERDHQRHRREVRRTYEALAKSIHAKFGTVEAYFQKQREKVGKTDSLALGIARFRALVKDVGIELEAQQLQRIFGELDEDNTGTVSMEELQKALSYHLTRDTLIVLSRELAEKYGSIVKGFEEIGEHALVAPQGECSPDAVGGLALPPPRTPEGTVTASTLMTEEKFRGILRRLRLETHLPAAHELYTALQPFTMQEFVRMLRSAHQELEEQLRQAREDEKRRERETERARHATRFGSRELAEKEVAAWIAKRGDGDAAAVPPAAPQWPPPGAAVLPGGLVEDVSRRWAAVARQGASKAQLRDIIDALQRTARQQEAELEDLQTSIAREEHGMHEYIGLTSHVSGFLMPSPDATPMGSPLTSGSEYHTATPASRPLVTPRTPMAPSHLAIKPELRAPKAEKLVQAAAVGDAAAVQHCLMARADINAVAWGGVTPLMAAAFHGRLEAVETLLAKQADLRRTDMRGRTAVDHALRRPATRELLRQRGGLSSQELAAEAEALARRVLLAEADRVRLEEARKQLPSETVKRRARQRGWHMGGGDRLQPQAVPVTVSFALPQGSPPQGPSPVTAVTPSSCLSAHGDGRPKPEKHVSVMLPPQAIRGGDRF